MKRDQRLRRGFSLIEMLIVIAIITIILTFAIPKLMTAVRGAKETSAVVAIQTIQKGQLMYNSSYNRFAVNLLELGPPAQGGAAGPSAAEVIDRELAQGEKGGYRFAMQATPVAYTVLAVPTTPANGNKTFYLDDKMNLHVHTGQEPATENDPLMGETAPQQQQSK
jgi:prepilin-type N-terminal cleavage/methylation domain-containing protein